MKSFLLTLAVVAVIVLVAVFLLGIRIWFSKTGKFPNTHIGGSKALKEKGITCATTQDAEARKPKKESSDFSTLIKDIDETL